MTALEQICERAKKDKEVKVTLDCDATRELLDRVEPVVAKHDLIVSCWRNTLLIRVRPMPERPSHGKIEIKE